MRYGTGMVMVLMAGVLWSFQALMIRQIEVAGPWTILVWRSLAMVPVLLAFLAWRAGGSPLPVLRRAGLAGVLGGIGLVAAMGGAILAFQTTTVANAAFLLAASPCLAAILGWLILREAVAPRTWGAIVLALVGIFLMVREGLAAGALIGNAAALVSALGFAAFSVALRWRRLEDSLPSSILGAAFAVVAGTLATVQQGQPLVIPGSDLMWCLLMGVVALSGGMVLYTLGSRVVPSAELTLLSNTEVLLAPFWVWLILGETASAGMLVGGAVVLAAILFNAWAGVRRVVPA
ncbi:DMT family transporter [Tabrizicola soli]|uniref:DMT family transporter n=1 Tax=Tabrizicola soli TaxID=2185115 RepID=A0ABV7DZN2_9RHOB|nr:DMT family transporter [Tabrizicola soli]